MDAAGEKRSDLRTLAVQDQLDLSDSGSSLRDMETQGYFSDDSLQSSPQNYGLLSRSSRNSATLDSSFCISELEEAFVETPDIGSPNSSLNATNHELATLDSARSQHCLRDSLTDQLAPRILIATSNVIAILGETVNLRVQIQSSDPATTKIGWSKIVRGIYRRLGKTPESDEVEDPASRHQITKDNGELISLSIKDVNYEDRGKYRVEVENLYGTDYRHCRLFVQGPPEPPSTPPKAKYDKISNAILISWHSCPYDGGSAVTGYCLEGSLHPLNSNLGSNATDYDNNWTVLTPTRFKGLCYTLESPSPAHSYRFRVSVENAHGKGKPSKPSNGVVTRLESGSDSGLPENPDRTLSR